ncbi:hypothetical protein ACP4OV_024194 [Aristida adscensionis]
MGQKRAASEPETGKKRRFYHEEKSPIPDEVEGPLDEKAPPPPVLGGGDAVEAHDGDPALLRFVYSAIRESRKHRAAAAAVVTWETEGQGRRRRAKSV